MSDLTDDLRGYSIGQILTRMDVEAIASAADELDELEARADAAEAEANACGAERVTWKDRALLAEEWRDSDREGRLEAEAQAKTAWDDALREASSQVRTSIGHAIFAGADPTDEEIAVSNGFADFILTLISQEPK